MADDRLARVPGLAAAYRAPQRFTTLHLPRWTLAQLLAALLPGAPERLWDAGGTAWRVVHPRRASYVLKFFDPVAGRDVGRARRDLLALVELARDFPGAVARSVLLTFGEDDDWLLVQERLREYDQPRRQRLLDTRDTPLHRVFCTYRDLVGECGYDAGGVLRLYDTENLDPA
jgi:hypothetical protein